MPTSPRVIRFDLIMQHDINAFILSYNRKVLMLSTINVENKTRIGVVGCGFYAQNHLNAWMDLDPMGASLVAVCDLDARKAKTAGEKFGARWFTDIHQMFDESEIDLLDVVTQMDSHKTIAGAAAKRKIAAVIQKPLAKDLEECVDIVSFAKKHDSWLAVHENFRFGTGIRKVKEVIDSGVIGSPNWARIAFRTGYDVYANQPYLLLEKRFAILDCGIHVLDLTRFFMGEVDRVFCETQTRKKSIAGEDTATMMLRHATGAVSVVEITYEAKRIPDPFPQTLLELEGSKGSIIVSHGERMTVTSAEKSETEHIGSALLPWTSHPWHMSQEAVLNTNAHMLRALSVRAGGGNFGRRQSQNFLVGRSGL